MYNFKFNLKVSIILTFSAVLMEMNLIHLNLVTSALFLGPMGLLLSKQVLVLSPK